MTVWLFPNYSHSLLPTYSRKMSAPKTVNRKPQINFERYFRKNFAQVMAVIRVITSINFSLTYIKILHCSQLKVTPGKPQPSPLPLPPRAGAMKYKGASER